MKFSCGYASLYLALVLTPSWLLAAKPSVEDAVAGYVAAGVPNGCAIESVLFVDWFNRQSFGGQARVVELQATTTQLGRFGHTVAVYSVGRRLNFWDVLTGGGELGLTLDESPTEETVRRALTERFETLYIQYRRGGGRSPIRRAIAVGQEHPALLAYDRLAPITRVWQIKVNCGGQGLDAVAFVYHCTIYVFVPERGTISGRFSTAPDQADCERGITTCLRRLFGGAVTWDVLKHSGA